MTDAARRCPACNRPVRYDDQFCFRCGAPTPPDDDSEATLPDEDDPRALVEGAETDTDEVTDWGTLRSGSAFNAQFRRVLGTEYELLSLIGQGGFARVYRARDQRLDRIVAIKVIRPDLVGTELFVDSFRNEGVALAKLRHPAIVPIYDIRERAGLIYYIMPYVEGTTLDERLSRGRLPPYESRRILGELTDALYAAHRAKMVHLDIKPSNVFLEGDLQKVLLMDFGTAMAVSDQIEESSGGPVVGTPEYMSPEQARGLPEIDHRSDIYSLGALGYRMLLGRPPFTGRDAKDTLEKHVTEKPVPIRDVNPTIPKDFADAIMRCLEKDPWDRFSTAKELGAALEAVTFYTTRGSTAAHEAASEPSRGVTGTAVALIGFVALVVGILAGLMLG